MSKHSSQSLPDPGPGDPEVGAHGYAVALAAVGTLGANPVISCLDVRLIQAAGLDDDQLAAHIRNRIPVAGEKAVVNYSLGLQDECDASPCAPSHHMPDALARAYEGLSWKERTQSLWANTLMVAAAGNEANAESTTIYPGMGDARFGSMMAVAAFADPFMSFVQDETLWAPATALPGFGSLAADPIAAVTLAADVQQRGFDGADDVADNVITVGSTINRLAGSVRTLHIASGQLPRSLFSDHHADVAAVGEEVFGSLDVQGTSLSAPQVAGLASYLWLLSPELRQLPSSVVKRAIVANARNGAVDAYAAVLSLDASSLSVPTDAPVRMAILDVNADTGFNELDIEDFLRHCYFVDPATNTITTAAPAQADANFSRYDLNGDGFTTSISRRERFELDRSNVTQFGETFYTLTSQVIEGQPVLFDEAAVTDVEILCYYAYSPLFQGDPDARRELLAGRCGLTIVPSSVTVLAGGTQTFQALGASSVSWSAQGGTIAPMGPTTAVYTAGTLGGTFTVRATRTDGVPTSDTSTVRVVPAGSTPQSFLTSLWQGVLSPVTSTNVPVSCSPGGSTLPVFIVLRPGGGRSEPDHGEIGVVPRSTGAARTPRRRAAAHRADVACPSVTPDF